MLTEREKIKWNRLMSMRKYKIVQYPLSQSGRKGRSMEGRICERGMCWVWNERVTEWWMLRVMMMKEMRWLVKDVHQVRTGLTKTIQKLIPEHTVMRDTCIFTVIHEPYASDWLCTCRIGYWLAVVLVQVADWLLETSEDTKELNLSYVNIMKWVA